MKASLPSLDARLNSNVYMHDGLDSLCFDKAKMEDSGIERAPVLIHSLEKFVLVSCNV